MISVMEAEVMAALVGTPAILVTAATAFAAGRTQARGAVDAVRRKDQRDTYAQLPHDVRKFLLAMPPVVGTPSRRQARVALQHLNDAMVELEDGALQVELEGPQEVADAAYAIVEEATELFSVTIRFLNGVSRTEGTIDRDAVEDVIDGHIPRLQLLTNRFASVASIALNGKSRSRRGDQVARFPRYVRFELSWPQDEDTR